MLYQVVFKGKSDGGMITEIMDQNSVVAYDEQQLKDMADYKLGNEKDMMKGLILGSGLLKGPVEAKLS